MMPVELHLPDLPEVPLSLGPVRGAARQNLPWFARLREALLTYLPLLLMALLALATWWLVKNSPPPLGPAEERAVPTEPDYTMSQFSIERFDNTGRLKVRIEGAQLRHFAVSDRIEIDDAQIHAFEPDGRVTVASAKRALSNGDGSEVQLMGGARLVRETVDGVPLTLSGEFLHAFLVTERVKSHLPVLVSQGGTQWRVGGLDYDHAARRLEMKGPARAVLLPRVAAVSSVAQPRKILP